MRNSITEKYFTRVACLHLLYVNLTSIYLQNSTWVIMKKNFRQHEVFNCVFPLYDILRFLLWIVKFISPPSELRYINEYKSCKLSSQISHDNRQYK